MKNLSVTTTSVIVLFLNKITKLKDPSGRLKGNKSASVRRFNYYKALIMEIAKNYISPKYYKNCILVNKQWSTDFAKLNHVIELHYKLKKEDWFTEFTHNVIKDKSLSSLTLIKCLIDTLEEPRKIPKKKHNYKMFNVLMIKTNPRLKFINFDGM